jgi:hypothetical protein
VIDAKRQHALKAVEDLTDIEAVVAALRKQKGGAAV